MKYLLQLVLLCAPLGLIAQEWGNEPLAEILSFAPTEVYDRTTEGISKEELKELLSTGESSSWVVTFKSDDLVTFNCKYPHSKISFFLLPHDNNTAILVAHTENKKVSTVELWERNEKVILEKIELLPAILAKDFFSEEHQSSIPDTYNEQVFYFVDGSTKRIKADLNTAILEEFEHSTTDYAITLNWNGTGFDVEKTAKTP